MLTNHMRVLILSFKTKPKYTLMRFFARFKIIRYLVTELRSLVYSKQEKALQTDLPDKFEGTLFRSVDIDKVVADLNSNGIALQINLPDDVVSAIYSYATKSICYAYRQPSAGFMLQDYKKAEEILCKKILLAQYFNSVSNCPEIKQLSKDPVLNTIARRYLKSDPVFVGANLWWTFAVDASVQDRMKHAHFFHRDVDDFRFLKFFFYITRVDAGDGAHVCVKGSQGKVPMKHFFDRWNIRRYHDNEVTDMYTLDDQLELCGSAGTGFAEDTWCLHKGQTPKHKPRLLLQLQFALFDYGVMHDQRDRSLLKNLI